MNGPVGVILVCIFAVAAGILLTYIFYKKFQYLTFLPTFILSIPVLYSFKIMIFGDSSGVFISEETIGWMLLFITAPVFLNCLNFSMYITNRPYLKLWLTIVLSILMIFGFLFMITGDHFLRIIILCIFAAAAGILLTYIFHKKLPYLTFLPTVILSIPVIYGLGLMMSGDSGGIFISDQTAGLIVLFFTAPVFLICLIFAVNIRK